MKILHVINSMDMKAGGPPRSLIPIANTQSKKFDVSIISSSKENFKNELFDYVKISFLFQRFFFPNLKSIKILFCTIRRNDYIHIHNWWNFISTFTLIFSSILKKKIIITPHGSLHSFNIRKSKIKKYLIHYLVEIFFIKNIDGLHYLTNNELENCFFKKKENIKKIVVPNSLYIDNTNINFDDNNNDYFLYMGRLATNKNIDFMIDVMNDFKNEYGNNFSFLIIGPDYGEKSKLQIKINNLNLQNIIKILEPNYTLERLSIIKNAKSILLASDYECNSIVIAEALALGVLAITTKECNTKEISDYGACITIDKDKILFVKNILKIMRDNEYYEDIKVKAKNYSKKFLNLNINTEKLVDLYIQI